MEQLDSSLVSYLPPIYQHELADIPPSRFSAVQQFLKEFVPSTDIRDVLLLYQQYVDFIHLRMDIHVEMGVCGG
jgi:hypothetical protein